MKVLVVGGNRFVGAELVNRLVLDGHDVTVLALEAPPEELARHVRWVGTNRNDEAALAKALAGGTFDAVFDNIAYEPAHVERLARALDGRLGHYVLTSSVDIYGLFYPRGYAEDEAPLDPSELDGITGHERYQRGKRACEKALKKLGIPWTVLRPCVVTGRFDNVPSSPVVGGVAPFEESSRSLFFAPRVLDGGPILLRRDDEGVFKLVWVQDVARAAALALVDPRMRGEAFNVSGDELWTTERYVRALCDVAGREPDFAWVSGQTLAEANLADYEPGYGRGPFWSVAPNHKLRALGWEPTPSDVWMAKLLESAPRAHQRAAYERRLQEIALARHVRRRAGFTGVLLPAGAPKERARQASAPAPTANVLLGFAQPAAAKRWEEGVVRAGGLDASHVRRIGDVPVSSIGLGTWMGDTSEATDGLYLAAIEQAVKGGINVVDTAINYRHMKAERCVGEALRRLEKQGVPRTSVIVSTKGGFITHDDADARAPEKYLREEYVERGLLTADDARRRHSIAPAFIRAQLEQSLRNLGLATVDVYFLHNPELAKERLGRPAFLRELAQTFEVLERAAADGKLRAYGLATWNAFLCAPNEPQYLSIEEVVRVAREVGGAGHHLRVLQLPFNAARTDAYLRRNQELHGLRASALHVARDLGLHVYTSASVLQGEQAPAEVIERLEPLREGGSVAMAALQFARSAPGVGTALVGMRRVAHVDEALALARRPCVPGAAFDNLC